MKKTKDFPETLYVERVDQGSELEPIFPAGINPADFAEKDRAVELGEYKLVRRLKVHHSVRVEDVD